MQGRGSGRLGLGIGLQTNSSNENNAYLGLDQGNRGSKGLKVRSIERWFKRAFCGVWFGQLDFEAALWQMAGLIIRPKKVCRAQFYHRQTKQQWARDDPAFVVLLVFALLITAIVYSIAFGASVGTTFRAIAIFIFLHYVIPGIVISFICTFCANRWLRSSHVPHAVDQQVEWAYAFDVHSNAFVPLYLILYVLQFILLPVLTKENFFSLFLSNTLYFVALVYYHYITFLGYSSKFFFFFF